jgi:TRAP-type transport system periplasmic protein
MKRLSTGSKILAAGLVSLGLAASAQAATTLTFTDNSPNRGTRAVATNWFAEELAKRTNGEVKIEFHWGGALLKAKAAPKGIGSGAADMGMIIGLYNPKLHHGYIVSDFPTEYSDAWVGNRATYDLATTNDQMIKEFDALNLKYITNVTTTEIQLVCKGKAVKSVADIKGIKVRGIGVYGKVFKDLGATPVRVSAYKAYQGLDTGLIDCSMFYGYAIPAFKIQEVAKELTMTNWGALKGLAYVMNKDAFNSLSPKNQKILTQLGSDFIDHYSQAIVAGNNKAYKDLAVGIDGNKMTSHPFSPAETQKLLDAGMPYVDAWKAKAKEIGMDGDALYGDYLATLKKYDDERKAKGYPWKR